MPLILDGQRHDLLVGEVKLAALGENNARLAQSMPELEVVRHGVGDDGVLLTQGGARNHYIRMPWVDKTVWA